jgi:hypothetical protein
MPSTVPKVVSVEVVPTRPTKTDRAMASQLAAEKKRSMPEAAYIVRIGLKEVPPATGHGWALYVDDTRIPKYWEYPGGIYFKVFDEEFLAEHQGAKLRFSENGVAFIDTGMKVPGPGPRRPTRGAKARALPLQSEVLNLTELGRAARVRAARKSSRRAQTKAKSKARGNKR